MGTTLSPFSAATWIALKKCSSLLTEVLAKRLLQFAQRGVVIIGEEQVVFTDDANKFVSVNNRKVGHLIIIHQLQSLVYSLS